MAPLLLSGQLCSDLRTRPGVPGVGPGLTQAPASLKPLAAAGRATQSPCPVPAGVQPRCFTTHRGTWPPLVGTVQLTSAPPPGTSRALSPSKETTISRAEARQTLYPNHYIFTLACRSSSSSREGKMSHFSSVQFDKLGSFAQHQGEGNSGEAASREGAGLEELGWGPHAARAPSWTPLIILASGPNQPHFLLAGVPSCPPEPCPCFCPCRCKLLKAAALPITT